jgi:ubiquinone/menaquinone biosynthesis C-methylase UbiE
MKHKSLDTSWETSAAWYDAAVGTKGHYYHEHLILPGVLRWLKGKDLSLLDLACGQGVLERHLPPSCVYVGIDGSPSLIQQAKKRGRQPNRFFETHDLSLPIELSYPPFTHASCILALQNIEKTEELFKTAHRYLKPEGTFVLVLNHPCFRIPRQSHWVTDEVKKLQSRKIDRYMSPLKIPIQTAPSQKGGSQTTWSFHHPLSFYSKSLFEAGFGIEEIEEWCSDKQSTGKKAAMENRSRREFPLFLAIRAKKVSLI